MDLTVFGKHFPEMMESNSDLKLSDSVVILNTSFHQLQDSL